jgi:hypothetical protein
MDGSQMKIFRPGEIVSIEGQEYKVMATNYDGKLILAPRLQKESATDMMTRLQSTVPNAEATLRVKESGEAEQRP